MLRELERLLGTPVEIEQEEAVSLERTDREDVAREPESAAWTAGIERAAESLETLEEAGGKSHQRFHARYPDAPPPAAEPAHAGPTTAQLRRAIIWSEILAPPVSLR